MQIDVDEWFNPDAVAAKLKGERPSSFPPLPFSASNYCDPCTNSDTSSALPSLSHLSLGSSVIVGTPGPPGPPAFSDQSAATPSSSSDLVRPPRISFPTHVLHSLNHGADVEAASVDLGSREATLIPSTI